MNWTPYLAVWSVLALAVIALAVRRHMLSAHEDDSLHVSEGGARLLTEQVATAHKIEAVEKWGKSLTIVVAVAGLIMAGIYFYQVWQTGATGAIVK